MKTISEMQVLVKDAYAKLDELSKSLAEYNISSEQTESVDFQKLNILGRRHPLAGHALAKADERTQKHYVTLLIALVQLATENQARGWLFVQRIACGLGTELELAALAADALRLTEKQLDAFSENILSANLHTALALDCMLAYISCEHKNTKMLDFIAALLELVKCSETEVKEITSLAVPVAAQDVDGYLACSLKNKKIDASIGFCYLPSSQAVVVNELKSAKTAKQEYLIIHNADIHNLPTPINIDEFAAKTIWFYRCRFDHVAGVKSQRKKVVFQDSVFTYVNKKVQPAESSFIELRNCELQNCEFSNCSVASRFMLIKNGNLDQCVFRQCAAKSTPLFDIVKGNVDNCRIEKCKVLSSEPKAILMQLKQGVIEDSIFSECAVVSTTSYFQRSMAKTCMVLVHSANVRRCSFYACSCNSQGKQNIIALQNSKEIDNTFSGCTETETGTGNTIEITKPVRAIS